MRRSAVRSQFARYAAAWTFLGAVVIAEIVYALLPAQDQAAVLQWASTNVHNLQHDPAGCMIASAFFPAGSPLAWPPLIALAMFGANHVLGNWRTVVTCAAGHVIGTLVSEGIVWYRADAGMLPDSARYIIDVGPSYVVVTAIAVALLYGPWLARAAAALDLVLLVVAGQIFAGISNLEVAPVGHATALTVGATLGGVFAWRARRRGRATASRPASVTSP
jgi:hypothetical protein